MSIRPILKSFALALCVLFHADLAQAQEVLMINWPEEYEWKIGSEQEDEAIHMIEIIPGKETVENWTIIGTMMSIKGAQGVPMDMAMNLMFDQAKDVAPKSKLTLVEKDETGKHPWVIFKIESPQFIDDKKPESQLYYIVQGSASLYTNFVAIKEKSLPKGFVEKWTAVFKQSEIGQRQ